MSDILKAPSLDKTESMIMLGSALLLGYLAYRLYTAGGTIANSVGATVDKVSDMASGVVGAVESTYHSGQLAATKVGAVLRSEENLTMNTADQSGAEYARLNRGEKSIVGPSWLESTLSKFNMSGMQDSTATIEPEEGPNAISQEWGIQP